MIPVEMGQENRHRPRLVHRLPEADDARSGVEHQLFSGVVRQLDARRVAAVSDRLGSGPGHRAAHPPNSHTHVTLNQNGRDGTPRSRVLLPIPGAGQVRAQMILDSECAAILFWRALHPNPSSASFVRTSLTWNALP